MTTIGWIGLGVMGSPMAANLVKAGYDVVGYDREHHRVERLVAEGGREAASASSAADGQQLVITMLPDSPDVEEVLLGSTGVFAAVARGALVVDMSTIRPDVSCRIAEAGASLGLRVLDAPVSGGEQAAVEATLSIMVGGEEADVELARPILEKLGATVVRVGPAGAGQIVKAANQLIVAGTIELVAEAIVLLEAYGADTDSAIKVLANGLAGNAILQRKAAGMLKREFKPGFRVSLHHKDLGIVQAVARQAGVIIPMGSLAGQLMASLEARGDGGLDHSALLKLVEELSGRSSSDRSFN